MGPGQGLPDRATRANQAGHRGRVVDGTSAARTPGQASAGVGCRGL